MMKTTLVRLLGIALLSLTFHPALGQYSAEVLADSPIAYYRLSETSGTTATNEGSLGAAANGTFANLGNGVGPNNIGQPGPRLGDLAGGFAIDGFNTDNNAVRFAPLETPDFPRVEVGWDPVGANPLALSGSGGLTLEAWIFRDPQAVTSGNDNEGIVSRYQDNLASPDGAEGRSYNLYYDDDFNGFGLAVSGDGNFTAAGTLEAPDFDVPIGEWVHVMGTFSPDPGGTSSTMTIYANGSLVAERSTTVTSLYTGAADFWIGQQFSIEPVWTFEGTIDEVAVYDKALSAARALAHYEAATTNIPTSFSWNVDASGDWNEPSNWSFNTVPNSNAISAVFGSAIGESRVIYTNQNRTVKGLTFASNVQYLLAGAGSVTLEADSGDATISAVGTHEVAVAIVLNSNTTVSGGFLNFSGSIDLNGNDLSIQDGVTNLISDVVSSGGSTISNGGTLGTEGPVAVEATLNSTGVIDIDIAGSGILNYDSFNVLGDATVAGTLDVQLFNGYEPAAGEMFTVLSATNLIDNGIALAGPSAASFSLAVVNNSLVLTALAALQGDFNGDGIVNLADYTVWRDNLGAANEAAINNLGDGLNGVDVGDYNLWKQNFGQGTPATVSAQSVPEPATFALLAIAGCATLLRRKLVVMVVLVAVSCPSYHASAQYSVDVLADSPVAYYQLNEEGVDGLTFFAENSTATIGIDAALQNLGNFGDTGPNNIGQVGPRPGDIAGGYVIDGFSATNRSVHFGPLESGFSRLEVTDDAVAPNPLDVTGSLTLEAWVNRDAQTDGGNNEGILSKYIGTGGNRSYNLFYDPVPGRIGFVLSETGAFQGGFQITSETDIAIGEWTHLVATYDQAQSTMSLYVNGQLSATQQVAPAAIFDSAADFRIGNQFGDASIYTFEGRIDEAAIYDRALSGAEVVSHFEAATGAAVATYEWNVDASGGWADLNNWAPGGVPNRDNADVLFGNAISSPQTVYYEDPTIVRSITFDSAQPYFVAGLQQLRMRADGGNASIVNSQGDHVLQSPIRLDSTTDLIVSAGSLTFSSTIDLNGNDLVISGAGVVHFDGRILPTDVGTVVNTGALALSQTSTVDADVESTGELILMASSLSSPAVTGTLELDGVITPVFDTDFDLASDQTIALLTAGSIVDAGVVLNPLSADKYRLRVSDTQVFLSAVPEPSAVIFALMLGVGLAGYYRRGRR